MLTDLLMHALKRTGDERAIKAASIALQMAIGLAALVWIAYLAVYTSSYCAAPPFPFS